MSSHLNPNQTAGEKDGLTKYIKRMKTVLKGPSSTSSTSSTSDTNNTPTMRDTTTQPESTKTETPKTTTAPTPQYPTKAAHPPTVMSHWSAVQEEKARALFAKYGLTLEPGEWKSSGDVTVERVAKPIRMRVRRSCHRCQTSFGPDRVCVNCQHVRCKKCPRHPPTESKDHNEAALQAILGQKGNPDPATKPKVKEPLKLPSRTGGQDLVHKSVRQRVRRTCHRCNTTFAPGSTECSSCEHVRCKKCPRDPPKLHKYPDGYPGDADPPKEAPVRTWKKPRQRVRYSCHECSTVFRSRETICSNCGQEKGAETIRSPAKKHKPEPDPEIVKKVEERLANITFSTG